MAVARDLGRELGKIFVILSPYIWSHIFRLFLITYRLDNFSSS